MVRVGGIESEARLFRTDELRARENRRKAFPIMKHRRGRDLYGIHNSYVRDRGSGPNPRIRSLDLDETVSGWSAQVDDNVGVIKKTRS